MNYFSTLSDLAIFGLADFIIVGVGILMTRRWTIANDAVPIRVATVLSLLAVVAYATVSCQLLLWGYGAARQAFEVQEAARVFGDTVEVPAGGNRALQVWVFCLLFALIPAVYYARMIIASITDRGLHGVSPIESLSEYDEDFSAARNAALHGDITGAVKRYRSYTRNKLGALFAAARLMENEGKLQEASALFHEISQRYADNSRAWSEATYRLAKLHQSFTGDINEANALLKEIVSRMPNSQYGLLAGGDLRKQGHTGGNLLAALDAAYASDSPSGKALKSKPSKRKAQAKRKPSAKKKAVAKKTSLDKGAKSEA